MLIGKRGKTVFALGTVQRPAPKPEYGPRQWAPAAGGARRWRMRPGREPVLGSAFDQALLAIVGDVRAGLARLDQRLGLGLEGLPAVLSRMSYRVCAALPGLLGLVL